MTDVAWTTGDVGYVARIDGRTYLLTYGTADDPHAGWLVREALDDDPAWSRSSTPSRPCHRYAAHAPKSNVTSSADGHAERFRAVRAGLADRSAAVLCVNLVVPPTPQPRRLLDPAHWYCKLIYTEDAIMLGKFAGEVPEPGEDGRALPVPPFTFLSIRSAVRQRDGRFFDADGELRRRFDRARVLADSPLARLPGCEPHAGLIREAILGPHAVEPRRLVARLIERGLPAALERWREREEVRLGVAA